MGELQGDPAVYVGIKRSGDALLFDLGDLSALSHRELLKVKHVFVSHTHMDHFMDFDRLLRVHVPHKRQLNLYGPKGLATQVSFKLRAYTWNLIDEDQLDFVVTEWRPDETAVVSYAVNRRHDFKVIELQRRSVTGLVELVQLKDGSRVEVVALDHKGIDSLAYRLRSPVSSKIDATRMQQDALKPGPWIKSLQSDYASKQLQGQLDVHGTAYDKQYLADRYLQAKASVSLVYLTDVGFDRANLRSLSEAFTPSNILISECSFQREERQRALDKAHLTSLHAAMIGALLGVNDLQVFHVSNLYAGREQEIQAEALREFSALQRLSADDVWKLVESELTLLESFGC